MQIDDKKTVVVYVSFSAFRNEDGVDEPVIDFDVMELLLPEKAWRGHLFTIDNIKYICRQLESKGYNSPIVLGIIPTTERNVDRAIRGVYPLRQEITTDADN